ncbi:MAG: helix-turn-helix transcriptional regulator, partial [Kiritimatiellae bacterium]|nr:helix-turn-helix transcriptional regulator [Kiritimatiellia bacterium]
FLKQLADWREAGGRILWVGNSIPAEVYPEGSRALDWIDAHACEGVGAADVARAMRCSRSLLNTRFRELGCGTVLTALTRRRLREVERLLRETADPIEDICEAAGFRDPSGLRRLFRSRFNSSMRQWREAGRR